MTTDLELLKTMKNQPGTMKNYENRPGTMKNQPRTMKNHENRPGTGKNQPKTMKKNIKIHTDSENTNTNKQTPVATDWGIQPTF